MNEYFMKLALEEARAALKTDDVPVGAVIIKNGAVVSRGHNMCEKNTNCLLHAEIAAINSACRALGSKTLEGCILYVTLEPCPMCAGAILAARIEKTVFGAYEEKSGAVGSRLNLFYDYKFNHTVKFCGGVLENECAAMLTDFFEKKRG